MASQGEPLYMQQVCNILLYSPEQNNIVIDIPWIPVVMVTVISLFGCHAYSNLYKTTSTKDHPSLSFQISETQIWLNTIKFSPQERLSPL